jgi:hypothetical protein
MTDRELLKKLLDALDNDNPDIQLRTAIALRERLAQPERKWVGLTDDDYETLSQFAFVEVIEKVEALLKGKNGG